MGFAGMVLHGRIVFSILWSSHSWLAVLLHQLCQCRQPPWPLEDMVVQRGMCRITNDSGPPRKVGAKNISWHHSNIFIQNSLIVLWFIKNQILWSVWNWFKIIFQLLCYEFTIGCRFCFERYLTRLLGNLGKFPQIQTFKNFPSSY